MLRACDMLTDKLTDLQHRRDAEISTANADLAALTQAAQAKIKAQTTELHGNYAKLCQAVLDSLTPQRDEVLRLARSTGLRLTLPNPRPST